MKYLASSKRGLIIGFMIMAIMAISVSGLFAEEGKAVTESKSTETKSASPVAAPVAEEKPTGDLSISALSQYIWRGYELSRNSVVLQPSMTVNYKGFTTNVWGNMDMKPYYAPAGDTPYTSTLNETDLTLSYSKTLGIFNVGGGYIYYALAPLNKDAPKRSDAQEVFVTAGLNTLLTPTLTVYKEIDHYHNWYFQLGISHAFEFNKIISLKLAATASYLLSTDETTYPKFDGNVAATKDKFNNFHDGNLTISLPIKATSYITLTPTISYVFPLSDDAKNEMKGFGMSGKNPTDRDSSFIYGGLTASLSF